MPSVTTDRAPHRGRVPVEQRVLGLDRRTFPLAFFVLAVFLVATVVMPRIDDAVAWDDPVRAGERLALTETVAFTPVVGWNVESGFRVGEGGSAVSSGRAVVVGDGVTFAVVPDDFDGTPSELLDQVEKVTSATEDPTFRVEGEPTNVTTAAGATGVQQTCSSVLGDGLVAAFVLDGTGLKITAYGAPAAMRAAADDVTTMIASITADGGTA